MSTSENNYDLPIVILVVGELFLWPLLLADLTDATDAKCPCDGVKQLLYILGIRAWCLLLGHCFRTQLSKEGKEVFLGWALAAVENIKKVLTHFYV